MDELKSKFLDLLHKQQDRNLKIPSMGFIDYHAQQQQQQNASTSAKNKTNPSDDASSNIQLADATKRAREASAVADSHRRLPDQEILDGMEDIYYEADADCVEHELLKFNDLPLDYDTVDKAMLVLRQQHKVVATKVLQHILDQRPACDAQLSDIAATGTLLATALADCRSARADLQLARRTLTANSLRILAAYRKRETLNGLMRELNALRELRDAEMRLRQLLDGGRYADAIAVLLDARRLAGGTLSQYRCVAAVADRLRDTLLLTELRLDGRLAEMAGGGFDSVGYGQLQLAFGLLGKRTAAVDQLHMHFAAAVRRVALDVLRRFAMTKEVTTVPKAVDSGEEVAGEVMVFEQLCDAVPSSGYTQCYIELCKAFWNILVCYYQASVWHQNERLDGGGGGGGSDEKRVVLEDGTDVGRNEADEQYVQEKFKRGQLRMWTDVQTKCCTLLASRQLQTLKYEQFIQVLSIVQRLRRVGNEFCSDPSGQLMEAIRTQSLLFFGRYHSASLEEICLFVDHESWMPVAAFTDVGQLQEFRSVRSALQRHQRASGGSGDGGNNKPPAIVEATATAVDQPAPSSLHSQEDGAGSSVYGGSCGYFYSFAEKSSPFDGGFDDTMLEEDILAGIADESCYYSEDDDAEDGVGGSNDNDTSASDEKVSPMSAMVVCNSSLNVLRCIGRYLQMCRLLHSISPNIVASMTELVDFYTFVVHDVFGSDLPVPSENLYTLRLTGNLERIAHDVIPKVKNWPPTFAMIQVELCNPDQLYGLRQRTVAVESACCLIEQFDQLRGYLGRVLPLAYRQPLHDYVQQTSGYVGDLRQPIYMCVTARIVDLSAVLSAIGRQRWDMQHVGLEQSSDTTAYVAVINRAVQLFAMRLGEDGAGGGGDGSSGASEFDVGASRQAVWESLAHVLTRTLVEGYSLAKRCTAAGRALMQLDVTHCMSVLEMLARRKFAAHRAYVDGYIKAYYMPKAELESWVCDRLAKKVYSEKQLVALVGCVCVNDRKARQRLLQLLELQGAAKGAAATTTKAAGTEAQVTDEVNGSTAG